MQLLRNCFTVVMLLGAQVAGAQKHQLILDYINVYKDIAISEMKRTGVPAAITLAQGIHESGAGAGKLVQASNNHFGIKCKSNWTGESVRHNDDEKGECFRKYPQAADSYKDHSDFLKNGQRYAFLFALDPADYSAWAHGLKQAGYATNPKYPQVLIKLIEDYGLQHYTFIAMGRIPDKAAELAHVTTQDNPAEPVTSKTEAPAPVKQYPEGVFKINDTKVVFVKNGTSFLSLARQYDVDLSKIFEFNEMKRTEATDRDQLVYLQRKRKTGLASYHVVKAGETLHSIAQQQGIRLESLRELNWLNEQDMPAVGERLNLQTKSTTIPKLTVKDKFNLVPATGKKRD